VTRRILVVDNADGSVPTLVHDLRSLGASCELVSDDLPPPDVRHFAGVLVSPGPGRPEDARTSAAAVKACANQEVPLLGVCLGHQVVATVFGGRVGRGPVLLRGSPSAVQHLGEGVLAGLPSPFAAARYHTLSVISSSMPADLVVTARTNTGEVMAVRHRSLPIEGVQFRPEAVLTQHGHLLLANWLTRCGLPVDRDRATHLANRNAAVRSAAGFRL
jgi:para-aminobenzoate synthetase component II